MDLASVIAINFMLKGFFLFLRFEQGVRHCVLDPPTTPPKLKEPHPKYS